MSHPQHVVYAAGYWQFMPKLGQKPVQPHTTVLMSGFVVLVQGLFPCR